MIKSLRPLFLSLASLILVAPSAIAAEDAVSKAINASERPAKDRESDANRKPGEFIRFMEITSGMDVLDVFSGGGYYTEVVSRVVGPQGSVDAHNNAAYMQYMDTTARYENSRLPNTKELLQEANELSLSKSKYDRILLVLSFHDFYFEDLKINWPKIDAKKFMSELKQSLKPNGTIGIIDHNAVKGADISVAQTLHRIDSEFIKQKMSAWGFELVGESDHLRNPDDPLTIHMGDPSIRGKTDRVVYKFAVAK